MVAAQQRDAVGVADFQRQQQKKRLNGVVAAVDKVAQEEVVVLGDTAADLAGEYGRTRCLRAQQVSHNCRLEGSDLEQLHEVKVLSVDVAANLQGRSTQCEGNGGRPRALQPA